MAAAYGTRTPALLIRRRDAGDGGEEHRARERLAFFGERLMGIAGTSRQYSLSYANRCCLEIAAATATNRAAAARRAGLPA